MRVRAGYWALVVVAVGALAFGIGYGAGQNAPRPEPTPTPTCEEQLAERGLSPQNPIIRAMCRDAFGRPLRTPAVPPPR